MFGKPESMVIDGLEWSNGPSASPTTTSPGARVAGTSIVSRTAASHMVPVAKPPGCDLLHVNRADLIPVPADDEHVARVHQRPNHAIEDTAVDGSEHEHQIAVRLPLNVVQSALGP